MFYLGITLGLYLFVYCLLSIQSLYIFINVFDFCLISVYISFGMTVCRCDFIPYFAVHLRSLSFQSLTVTESDLKEANFGQVWS